MRHLLAALLAVTLVLVSACGGRSGPAGPAIPAVPGGPTIVFAVPASAELDATAEIVDARLQAAGLGRAEVGSREPPQVLCRLVVKVSVVSQDQAVDPRRVAPWIGGRGEVEFRIVAAGSEAELEKRETFAERYRLPPGIAWLPDANGGPDVLVEIPEQAAEAALERALDEVAPQPRVRELRAALAAVVERDVFGSDDIAEAAVHRSQLEFFVYFAMSDDRREAFREFTERNVKRQLAIVVDDRVLVRPVIRSSLPGEGVISGAGGPGFHGEEAAALAAILDQQLQLPVTLELVRIDEPPQ